MLIMMTKCQCLHYFPFRFFHRLHLSSFLVIVVKRRFILFADRMLHVFVDDDEFDGMIGTFSLFCDGCCAAFAFLRWQRSRREEMGEGLY